MGDRTQNYWNVYDVLGASFPHLQYFFFDWDKTRGVRSSSSLKPWRILRGLHLLGGRGGGSQWSKCRPLSWFDSWTPFSSICPHHGNDWRTNTHETPPPPLHVCKYLDQNLHQNDLSISQLHNVRTFIPINLPFPICIHGARFDWNTKFIFYVY